MYTPKEFILTDRALIHQIMEVHSFAILISQDGEEPIATHLPLLLNPEENCLYGHFARANKQWQNIFGQTAMAVFQGPHAYISPSWYETGTAVPTWNYVSVHAYGKLEIIDDETQFMRYLEALTNRHEAQDSSYQFQQLPEGYAETMLKGIVGFSLQIDRLEGKAKLSQNHPKARQELVAAQLKKAGGENQLAIAEWMEKHM